MKLDFSYKFSKNFFGEHEVEQIKPYVELANEVLVSGKGAEMCIRDRDLFQIILIYQNILLQKVKKM